MVENNGAEFKRSDEELEFINRIKNQHGYYTIEELIKQSENGHFTLENPRAYIRIGTEIKRGSHIKDGSRVDGENVIIGEGTILENALIRGSDINIGQNNLVNCDIIGSNISIGNNNKIYGKIALDNILIGNGNEITDLFGNNTKGKFILGDENWVKSVKIDNFGPESIEIGNFNKLHPGLSINCIFPFPNKEDAFFKIKIGHKNSLGRDGGGVISTSYRFENGWGGHVIIGSNVETTRGAEILGWSLMGFSSEQIMKMSNMNEDRLKNVFLEGKKEDNFETLINLFGKLFNESFPTNNFKTTSLYGVAKIKRSCLLDRVQIKDDVRTLCSFINNRVIAERCKIYFSSLRWDSEIDDRQQEEIPRIHVQDRAIEQLDIWGDYDWSSLPDKLTWKKYPKPDYDFYE